MNPERIKLLEQYVREDPNDSFSLYALGLEWMGQDDVKAVDIFDSLLTRFPDYLPVYYQAGLLLLRLGDHERARKVVDAGITKARNQGQGKTQTELQSLADELD